MNPEILGRKIGPFQPRKLLGKGGMGDVYLADRIDGEFDQQVALKILRHAFDGEMLERFRVERRIQAQLEHPNISRLLDGGTTMDGLPWFAMEWVDGLPIDEYCDRRRLDVRARIEVFRQVCEAVQFAHSRLVVHRDLKPSNILVDADGVPKLLDFGIAKLLNPTKSAEIVLTAPGMQPMTIRYASPEQIREASITTATDVYALGVLLHLLLAGRLPLGLESLGFASAAKKILEEEPELPSSLVERREEIPTRKEIRVLDPVEIAEKRRTTPPKLRRSLQGDLDAVLLKALQKEPEKRFASAERFAEETQNYLDGLPVDARRAGAAYHVAKFVRRNRWALTTAASVIALLAAFGVWEYRRITAESERVIAEAERAAQVSLFLEGIFGAAHPDAAKGGITMLDLLEYGRAELENLRSEPELYSNLNWKLGAIAESGGYYQEAGDFWEESLRSWFEHSPVETMETAQRIHNIGIARYRSGRYADAEQLFRQSIDIRERLGQGTLEASSNLNGLASVLIERGAYDEALEIYRRVLTARRDSSPKLRGSSLRNVGRLLIVMDQLDEAEALLKQALALRIELYGEDSVMVGAVRYLLGDVALARGDTDAAEKIYRQVLHSHLQSLKSSHPQIAYLRRNLATILLRDEPSAPEIDTAAVLLDHTLSSYYPNLPPDNRFIAEAHGVLGLLYSKQGRKDFGEACLYDSRDTLRNALGPDAKPARIAEERLNALENNDVEGEVR